MYIWESSKEDGRWFDKDDGDAPKLLCEKIYKDLDTYVVLKMNDDNQFQYWFWAFDAYERVFQVYLCKLIEIDAIHLSDKYPSVLLMTTIVGDNGKLMPIVFSIVEVDYAFAWEWFLNNLKIFLVVDLSIMPIVSDKYRGIISTVSKVYPNAHMSFVAIICLVTWL